MVKNKDSIKIFAPEDLFPSERAYRQLSAIIQDNRIRKPVLGLIDIHDKKGNDFPTGIVVASPDHIFPQLMVSGPNCGMRMITTPLHLKGFGDDDINRLFTDLSKTLHTSSFLGSRLSDQEIMDIMLLGANWVYRKFPGQGDESANIELNGNAFSGVRVDEEMIHAAVPKTVIDISKHRMGILGRGNHFLELQVVDTIFDKALADSFSLSNGQLVFLMHSGSGGLGAILSHLYSPNSFEARELKMHALMLAEWLKSLGHTKRRNYIKNMLNYIIHKKTPLFGLQEGSELANLYLTAIRASSNFGYANRTYIGMQIKESFARCTGANRRDAKTLYDVSHMSINKESHNGEFLWIHRTGGVRALSSGVLPDDDIFKKTGVPVLLPGSMGSSTYVCVSLDSNSKSLYSVSHGAGRISKSEIEASSCDREELLDYMNSLSVKLYGGNSKNIIKQDPRCFKNMDKAVSYLETEGLTKKVARLKPVAVLKG